MALRAVPATRDGVNKLIADMHRHHKPVVGYRFAVVAMDGNRVCGAAVVGRPVARELPQYTWAEVTRLVTDGTKNACSFLYSRCARICREMGFERIQTYILESESGASLRASGWEFDGWTEGGDWNTPARKGRRTDQPMERKQRWKKDL